MSPEKKVFLLFLSLVILIVACVYTHIDEFMAKAEPTVIQETKVELKNETKSEIQEVETTEENVDETLSSETIKNDTELETESLQNESVPALGNEEIKEEIVEEPVVEKPIEPLITTDKRYNRVGNEKNIEELSTSAQLLQIKINDYVKENPIVFRRGSNKITQKSVNTVDAVAKALKEFPNIKIEIAGHTDAAGPTKLNQTISYQRAKKIGDILANLEIDKNRMIIRGYGESIPMVKNSPQGYSKVNRRVEFNIVEE